MDTVCLTSPDVLVSPTGKGPERPCLVTPIFGSSPHAMMMDVTHDNQSPLDKRTAEDALSTGALATFCFSAVGSNKGFDDLYPKLLDLVSDTRKYELAGVENGIGKIKRILNHLHAEFVLDGFTEGHVHQENDVSLTFPSSPSSSPPSDTRVVADSLDC
jgi:glycogen debranching enzyme